MGITELIDEMGELARYELRTPVEIEEPEVFPELDDMYSEVRRWIMIEDVVALVADLKGSTRLDYKGKHANTSARLYEAVTGCGVRLLSNFDPQFVDIQGDGFFALFHGAKRYERALCAGITLKTFSERELVPAIGNQMGERFPKTGLKVGLAASTLTVKRVGTRKTKEPIWAGKAVNWATKCAQAADAHQLIAASKIFSHFQSNEYVTYSCGCSPDGTIRGCTPRYLWHDTVVEALGEHESRCKVLSTMWCVNCGSTFCQSILVGNTKRGLTTTTRRY